MASSVTRLERQLQRASHPYVTAFLETFLPPDESIFSPMRMYAAVRELESAAAFESAEVRAMLAARYSKENAYQRRRNTLEMDADLAGKYAQTIIDDFLMRLLYSRYVFLDGHHHSIETGAGMVTGRAVRSPLIASQEKGWSRPRAVPVGDVIPNDLFLDGDTDVLVITGPNTGGKTTLALLHGFMAISERAGLYGAGEQLKSDVFPGGIHILKQRGDDRTTGTSNLGNDLVALRELLKKGDKLKGALIIMDDLLAGGNHRESAAILRAVIERLVSLGAKVAIATNLDDVYPRSATESTPDANGIRWTLAAMQFKRDAEGNVRPTYTSIRGAAGASMTTDIAANYLPPDIVASARNLMAEGHS